MRRVTTRDCCPRFASKAEFFSIFDQEIPDDNQDQTMRIFTDKSSRLSSPEILGHSSEREEDQTQPPGCAAAPALQRSSKRKHRLTGTLVFIFESLSEMRNCLLGAPGHMEGCLDLWQEGSRRTDTCRLTVLGSRVVADV